MGTNSLLDEDFKHPPDQEYGYNDSENANQPLTECCGATESEHLEILPSYYLPGANCGLRDWFLSCVGCPSTSSGGVRKRIAVIERSCYSQTARCRDPAMTQANGMLIPGGENGTEVMTRKPTEISPIASSGNNRKGKFSQ